jgi:hypothetical protein
LTVKATVLVAIVEFRSDAVAHHYAKILIESEVTRVENAVDVAPQKHAIGYVVLATATV